MRSLLGGCGSTKQVTIYAIFIFFFCPSFMQHNTIEDILGRGEKLDDLVDKSEGLTLQSKAFYKTVSEIKEGGRGLKENCLAQLCGCEIHIHIVWCIFFIIGNGVFEIFRLASGRFFGLLMWSFASFQWYKVSPNRIRVCKIIAINWFASFDF